MRASQDARSPWLRRWVGVCLAIVGVVLVSRAWTGVRAGDARAATPEPPVEVVTVTREPEATPAPPPRVTEPAWRSKREAFVARGDADVRVIPPRALGPEAPAVVTMLHGMTSSPSRTCARVEAAADMGMVVLCPTGNVDYGDGTADWTGDAGVKAGHIDRALTAGLAPLSLAPDASRGDVLMGFSRGAFVARDVAYERAGKWSGLVLIGAALTPDADKLRASGIERVVLASGDFDGARPTMVAARAKLCAAGMPARFVSLGPVWHALPEDTMTRMKDALAWARGEGSDEPPGCTPGKS